ncbi:hypothetical protein [Nocardioides aurantiacus]
MSQSPTSDPVGPPRVAVVRRTTARPAVRVLLARPTTGATP